MVYQLTKNGKNAVSRGSALGLSPQVLKTLQAIDVAEDAGYADLAQVDLQALSTLKEVGFIRLVDGGFKVNNLEVSEESEQIRHIKKQFVVVLRKKLANKEDVWEWLINLESINEVNGLLWFLHQAMTHPELENWQGFKDLYEQIEVLES